jgi:RNA polymerase sigma-70 factor (ECF subfamily)
MTTSDPDLQAEQPVVSPAVTLARTAATGDVQAMAHLLRLVAPRVATTVRAVMGAHLDCDDVVQQSLIALVQALPAFRGDCEPASYACRIAVRTAVAARRRARTHASRNESFDDQPHPTTDALDLDAASARRTTLIRELLEEIPVEQAECLVLRVVLGWSLEEVASASAAPVNTIRSRVRLAKEALRRRIEADPRLADELEVVP